MPPIHCLQVPPGSFSQHYGAVMEEAPMHSERLTKLETDAFIGLLVFLAFAGIYVAIVARANGRHFTEEWRMLGQQYDDYISILRDEFCDIVLWNWAVGEDPDIGPPVPSPRSGNLT